MRVGELLKEKSGAVVTLSSKATIADAVRTMIERRIGALPIVDDDKLLGLVDERAVVEVVGSGESDVRRVPVSTVLRRAPVCSTDDELRDVMARMTRERRRHLIALDGDRVAGILSLGDLVKQRLDELELETGVLRDYVAARRV